MRKPSYTPAQEQFIMLNCHEHTVKELSQSLGLTVSVIHNVGIKWDLTFKPATWSRVPFKAPKRPPVLMPVQPKVFTRPAAIYNQSGSPYGIASSMREL